MGGEIAILKLSVQCSILLRTLVRARSAGMALPPLALGAGLPIFAIGGIQPADLERARGCGAHGLAMIRGSWNLN